MTQPSKKPIGYIFRLPGKLDDEWFYSHDKYPHIDRTLPWIVKPVYDDFTAPGATTKSDGAASDDTDTCIACDIPLVDGDMVYSDASGGCIHAACCGPERESYVGNDGEPLKDGDPIPEPWPWTSDPSSTRSEVTVEDEPPENTTVGGITWHSSEEDSGPDVGISVYLGPDDRLWCGEISRRLFEEHDGPARFDSDLGAFIVRYAGKETTLIAKCADMDTGREFVEQIAEWVRKSALLDQFEIRRK